MDSVIDQRVVGRLSELFSLKSAWLGENPPTFADAVNPDPEKGYRLSPEMHGRYQVVWIYEHNLFDVESWPLLLDEMLRVLGRSGKLVLRASNNANGSIIKAKSYVYRHPGRRATLDWQTKTDEGCTVSVIDINRLNYAAHTSDRWSVGILTNGVKNENVINLINKMVDLANGLTLEFAVAGPFDSSWVTRSDLVKVIATDEWDDLARIGEKKYLLPQILKHENVAIFHDRYQIDDNFFVGFRDFGYDFDFVTTNQFYENGVVYPGYPDAGSGRRLCPTYEVTRYHKSPGMLFDKHYISGGLMIFKKYVLERVGFNPLALHPEAEDQEISFLLGDIGVPPRLNIFSSATTVGFSTSKTRAVIRCSRRKASIARGKLLSFLAKRIWSGCPSAIKRYLEKHFVGSSLYHFLGERLL